jgi:hypothetical protein
VNTVLVHEVRQDQVAVYAECIPKGNSGMSLQSRSNIVRDRERTNGTMKINLGDSWEQDITSKEWQRK